MNAINSSSFQRRISFQAKVLIPVVTVMILLIAVGMWLVNRGISRQLHEQAVRELDTSRKIFNSTQKTGADNILLRYGDIVNEPRFKAVTGLTDFNTTKDQLEKLIKDYINGDGATVATYTFLDGKGVAFADRDPQISSNEFQAASAVAVREAAKGQPQVDTICLGSNLFYVIALPVMNDNELAGVVTFGAPLHGDEARQIKQLTRSEIVFLADGQVIESSLDGHKLDAQLAGCFRQVSQASAGLGGNQTVEVPLGGEHFLCQTGYFPSLDGSTRLGYLLLSSYYGESTAVLKATQQMLLAMGLFGVGLSTLIVWFLIGRVTRPLRELRDSAEAVGRGDFSRRVEVTSHDECGELGAVFNQMTENVKTSREELEKTVETLKATQNQLIQSEKLSGIGEFVAGVAHELNNPLTSVMGFAELLQQSGEMPEQLRRYLDVIFKSAKRCQKIVASLLSFARRHAPERKVVCVNEIVESAAEILHYQMRTSNIEVVMQLDPNLPATEIDPHQMQQVFLNIINNARQAMEGRTVKGSLRITTEKVDDQVRISFQDNGPGIPPENIKKIFNPFFTTKEVGKGTGLGLSLCYGIVSEHGGTITPRSEPGQGATFVIELPISRNLPQAEKKATLPLPTQMSNEGAGKRVLVIDDEDTILQMISAVLTMNGYKVDVARDGETALKRLGQHHYDLALCDWKMPGLNGKQVYERLNETDPEMSRRLVFITGDVVNEKTQEFLSSRHKLCLTKPFTLVEFRCAIKRLMTSGEASS